MIILFVLIKMVFALFSCQFGKKIHFNNMDAFYTYFHIFTRFDYEYGMERGGMVLWKWWLNFSN